MFLKIISDSSTHGRFPKLWEILLYGIKYVSTVLKVPSPNYLIMFQDIRTQLTMLSSYFQIFSPMPLLLMVGLKNWIPIKRMETYRQQFQTKYHKENNPEPDSRIIQIPLT